MTYGTVALRWQDHRESLIRLWNDNLTDRRIAEVAADRIRWLYETNPAGAARTLLCVTAVGEPVGCASFIPRPTLAGGEVLSAAILNDFAMDRAHRAAGPAVALQRALAREGVAAGFDLLYGWPNDRARGVLKHIGHRVLGSATTWVKPLRARPQGRNPDAIQEAITDRVGKARIAQITARALAAAVTYPLLAPALGAVLDVSSLTVDGLKRLPSLRHLGAMTLNRADDRFDDLWLRARPRSLVMGVRTASYLNWRYADFTTKHYRFFCLADHKTKQIAGYLVFTIERRQAVIVDLFCENLESTLDALLAAFSLAARGQGADTITFTYFGTDTLVRSLKANLFFPRPGTRPVMAFFGPRLSAETQGLLADSQNWFMPDGELDI